GGGGNGGAGGSAPPPGKGPENEETSANGPVPNVLGCDPLDTSGTEQDPVCMYPFPNDYFTRKDASTDTGKRIDFQMLGMPRNAAQRPVDPTDWNRADGFSPGSMILAHVAGLQKPESLTASGAVPITDMARTYDANQPVVVINTKTGERHLIWAEMDMTVPEGNRALIIRPGANLEEGTRYVVALRNLKGDDGKTAEAPGLFKAYRDKEDTPLPTQESRRPHMESIFKTLDTAGIDRSSLYLAWDFTVASERSLSERALTIRDDAFKKLGDTNLADREVQGASPKFTIDKVTPNPDSNIARRVKGTMDVPCYLSTPACAPAHSQFVMAPGSNVPNVDTAKANTFKVEFQCDIPKAAFDAGRKVRPMLYGHGLLGGYTEMQSGNVRDMGNENDIMTCATDWAGMATVDVPNVATILTDLSNFNTLADRAQQGFLNFMFLGRAAIHPQGFAALEEFKKDGVSLIDTDRLFYDGNSQGGIMGGSLTALSPDFEKAALGVPGMNYSTLLTRSTDFGDGHRPVQGFTPEDLTKLDPTEPGDYLDLLSVNYAWPLYDSYQNKNERQLLFALIQMLWDRGEANGYAQHMTDDPLPNTPSHDVMLHVAWGDHQVAPVSAEVEARTIGAKLMRKPALDAGRHPDKDPFYKIGVAAPPFDGSALVEWDSGEPAMPTSNTFWHLEDEPEHEARGRDPHGHPRSTRIARDQKGAFLRIGGQVTDTCSGGPCYANGYRP
ncbi:MAG: hypothetical protein H0V29_03475, partial [Thermoleophilaceae bacterium]|nr:hypothetical protein [Thermoleophilaceae bacterium]